MENKTKGTAKNARSVAVKTPEGMHKGNRVKTRASRFNSVKHDGQTLEAEPETADPNSLLMLFELELKGIYNVEKQLLKALPEMAKLVSNEELKKAFMHHQQQTERHIERLENIFNRMRIDREETKCLVMEVLIQEGKKLVQKFEEGPVKDAAAIVAAQKIEHFEICVYGCLYEIADVLGYHKIADILDKTLFEEKNTDAHFSEIARWIHDHACNEAEMQLLQN